jgi:hypothetical protein
MFRFRIRDVLWLTVVVGLALMWRLEIRRRHSGSEELKRTQGVADEQEKYLDGIELYALDKDTGWGHPTLIRWAKQRRKMQQKKEALAGKHDPDMALVGEWAVVELIVKGKVQDLDGKPGGWMKFENGKWSEAYSNHRYSLPCDYTIVRPGEIDIDLKGLGLNGSVLMWLYEYKDGKLRMIRGSTFGERPTHFDALTDHRLNLYLLEKVK